MPGGVPSGVPAAPSVIVGFRIPNSLLVFVRNRADVPGRLFVADAEVTVQLFREEAKVGEQVWRGQQYAADFEATQSRTRDLEGAVRFEVPPGTYGYRLVLGDENTPRERPTMLRRVTVPAAGAPNVLEAVLAQTVTADVSGTTVNLVNLGGDLPYGRAAHAVVPLVLPAGAAPGERRLRYTLRRLPDEPAPERAERRRAVRTDAEAPPPEEPAGTPVGPPVAEGTVDGAAFAAVADGLRLEEGTLRWPASAASGADVYLAVVDLPGTTLEDGVYVLETELTGGGATASARTRFRTHWRDMPLSLYHPEVAIRNLSFIEDKKAVRALLKGGREEQEEKIRAYWAERDPTPETVYNELMAEYYRRVDDAAQRFRTGRYPFPDGLETDQGRVFVLNGPPDDVARRFPPLGGVEEVWTYADGRTFRFWAPTSLDPFELE